MPCTPPVGAEVTCEEVEVNSLEAGSGAGEARQPREGRLGRAWLAVEWDRLGTTMDGATEVLHSKGGELETGEVRGAEEEEEDRDNNKVEPSKGNRNHHLRIVFIIFSHSSKTSL